MKPILDSQGDDPPGVLPAEGSRSHERSQRSQTSRRKGFGDQASASASCSRAGRRHGVRHRRPGQSQSILVFTALSLFFGSIHTSTSPSPFLPMASAQPTTAPTTNTTSSTALPTSSPVTPSNTTESPASSSNITAAPVTAVPATAAPITSAPTTSAPVTPAPTAPPVVITWPTVPPTRSPTNSPTSSSMPSSLPSFPPTYHPTISPRPTYSPTVTASPSYPPSTSSPSVSPTKSPTLSPVIPPTASPSTNATFSIVRECNQILEVNAPVEFNDVEAGIYQLQMQSYTANFGQMVGTPFVVTTCTVTEQNLAGGRKVVEREHPGRLKFQENGHVRRGDLGRKLERLEGRGQGVRDNTENTQNDGKRSHLRLTEWLGPNPTTNFQTDILEHIFPSSTSSRTLQTTTPAILLVIQFNMQYESRHGIDIDDYPSLFQEYINANLEQVTIDMQTRFLPVVAAREVIVYNTKQPTLSPTPGGSGRTVLPTPVVPPPTPQGGSTPPTTSPSVSPIDFNATAAPSVSPTLSPVTIISTPPPTPPKEIIEDNTSFVVGLAAGLSGAALLVVL
ncbi:hypothetical protein ACHAXS_001334, partial [Conticribra weissflogii]